MRLRLPKVDLPLVAKVWVKVAEKSNHTFNGLHLETDAGRDDYKLIRYDGDFITWIVQFTVVGASPLTPQTADLANGFRLLFFEGDKDRFEKDLIFMRLHV
jgi:hypothetical protein